MVDSWPKNLCIEAKEISLEYVPKMTGFILWRT